MFRWGIMSTAKIAWEHFIPAINQSDNGILAGIASRDLARAKKMAVKYGALAAFGSYEEMLASPDIDAVYIPLPTSQHVEWTLKAAKAGKHVLCEKPIALKASEIRKLINARNRHGVIISEAFMVTYHPQWLLVRDLIKKGAIGKLRQVDGAFTYFNKDAKNMRNIPALGGGVIPDIAVYPTVTTRFATGREPSHVRAKIDFDPKFKTDCYASVQADFGDFELAFYISTQLALRQHMAFHGEKGFIELTAPFNAGVYEEPVVRLHDQLHSAVQEWSFTRTNQYRLEAEAFAAAALGVEKRDLEMLFPLEDSILNQKVIDAIYKAGRSGKAEKV